MKKILIVTNHSYMLYRFRKELIEALLKNNEVYISTPFVGHEDDLKDLGCHMIKTEVDRRGINPVTDLKLMAVYKQLIKDVCPDKVITYSIKPNVYMGFLCRYQGIQYFANVQGLGSAFKKKGLASLVTMMYKSALKKATTVFFENTANAQEFLDRNIINKNKIKVLCGAGINLDNYQYCPFPKKESISFLYLGRIMKEKGMDEWFDAVVKLKNEFHDKVNFDMVGFFEDEYKELVESLQKQGIINFHGFQSDPIPFYQNTSCVVLPSYHEGMSNVILEAQAIGRPVVTSNIPGCKEGIIDNKSGYLCEVKNADSLYEKMKLIVLQSNEQLEHMGLEGRKHMIDAFDKNKVVKETCKELMQ